MPASDVTRGLVQSARVSHPTSPPLSVISGGVPFQYDGTLFATAQVVSLLYLSGCLPVIGVVRVHAPALFPSTPWELKLTGKNLKVLKTLGVCAQNHQSPFIVLWAHTPIAGTRWSGCTVSVASQFQPADTSVVRFDSLFRRAWTVNVTHREVANWLPVGAMVVERHCDGRARCRHITVNHVQPSTMSHAKRAGNLVATGCTRGAIPRRGTNQEHQQTVKGDNSEPASRNIQVPRE